MDEAIEQPIHDRSGHLLTVVEVHEAGSLQTAELSDLDLSNADLLDVDLTGSQLGGTVLRGAMLRDACLYWVLAYDADFTEACLIGADLRGSFPEAVFDHADCRAARFDYDNLGRSGANLEGASFRGADLRGTKFDGARLEGAVFLSARYDRTTQFPRGFDPRAHAMIEL